MSYSSDQYRYLQTKKRSLVPVTHEVSPPNMTHQDYISPMISQYSQSSRASYNRSPAPAMSYSSSSDSNCSRQTTSSATSTYYYTDTNNSYTRSQSNYSTQYGSPTAHQVQESEPANSQIKRTHSRSSRQESQASPRYICVHPGCESSFSRPADLSRHQVSVHFRDGVMLDCPKPRCTRKGDQGFSRQDHLIEHLRQFHCMKLEKRSSKSQRRE